MPLTLPPDAPGSMDHPAKGRPAYAPHPQQVDLTGGLQCAPLLIGAHQQKSLAKGLRPRDKGVLFPGWDDRRDHRCGVW